MGPRSGHACCITGLDNVNLRERDVQQSEVVSNPESQNEHCSVFFSELVSLVSDYIATTASSLQESPRLTQASSQDHLLAITLASARLRTKLGLDALARFSSPTLRADPHVARAVALVLDGIEDQLSLEPSIEQLIPCIVQVDQELLEALQVPHEDDALPCEDLGQLITMFTMMRRACFFILHAETTTH